MTKIETAKKRLEGPGATGSGPDTWAYITADHAKSIAPPAFWLTENYYRDNLTIILEMIGFMHRVVNNEAATYPMWQERCFAVREIVHACRNTAPPRTGFYIDQFPSGYDLDIKRILGVYKPLNPIYLAEHLRELYHQHLLELEHDFTELYVWDLPAIYQGGGVVIAQHFLCLIGEAISLFKDGATIEAAQAQLDQIDKTKTQIMTFSRRSGTNAN